MLKKLEKMSKQKILLINIFGIFIIGILDYLTGLKFPLIILYFLPLIFIIWYLSFKISILFATIIPTYILFIEFLSKVNPSILALNLVKRILFFSILTIIIYTLKKNFEYKFENRLLIQRANFIIDTSQKIIAIVAENITKYNSEILSWINEKKANGNQVSKVIESNCNKIGHNMTILTKICFGQSRNNKNLNLEDFAKKLKKEINRIKLD